MKGLEMRNGTADTETTRMIRYEPLYVLESPFESMIPILEVLKVSYFE